MMAVESIPPEVAAVLHEFCATKRSGSVTLEIKDGNVLLVKPSYSIAVVKVDKSAHIT